jgi:hypothetical protein
MEPGGSLPHSQQPATCPYLEPDQSSSCPHSTSWRSILILPSHLHLGIPSGRLPSGLPTKILYAPHMYNNYGINVVTFFFKFIVPLYTIDLRFIQIKRTWPRWLCLLLRNIDYWCSCKAHLLPQLIKLSLAFSCRILHYRCTVSLPLSVTLSTIRNLASHPSCIRACKRECERSAASYCNIPKAHVTGCVVTNELPLSSARIPWKCFRAISHVHSCTKIRRFED